MIGYDDVPRESLLERVRLLSRTAGAFTETISGQLIISCDSAATRDRVEHRLWAACDILGVRVRARMTIDLGHNQIVFYLTAAP